MTEARAEERGGWSTWSAFWSTSQAHIVDDGRGDSQACKPHIVDKDISGCEFAKLNDEIWSGMGGVSCLADLLHEDGGEEAFLHCQPKYSQELWPEITIKNFYYYDLFPGDSELPQADQPAHFHTVQTGQFHVSSNCNI